MFLCGLFVAAAAFAAIAQGAAPPPTYDKQYFLSGTITLPYVNLVEPFQTYYDGVNNRQRIDYYNGMDSYVYRGDLGITFQKNPEIDHYACFETDGPVDIMTLLPPRLSEYEYQGDAIVKGQKVQQWRRVQTIGAKTNTYDFYVELTTQNPVQFHMMGYDIILGSHYDEYVVDYEDFFQGSASVSPADFAKPNLPCGPFPGPGFMDPRVAFKDMFSDADAVNPHATGEFKAFVEKYGLTYSSDKEVAERESAFLQSFRFVHTKNRQLKASKSSMRLAINRFADMLPAERKIRAGVGMRRPKVQDNGAAHLFEATKAKEDLPKSMNWTALGAVTPVKDQGICGSCWSFGTTGTLEGSHFVKTGNLVPLSQQELMDCSWNFGNNACDGGEDFRAYQWIMQNGGLATSASYGPYLMQDGWCGVNRTGLQTGVVLESYTNVTMNDETALMQAIAEKGPISVSIDASLQSFSYYGSGVFYDPECKNGVNDLDHSVLAVGYGTENGEDYWLIKNSWSTHWGDNGYVKISRKNNNCGVATQPTFATLK